MQTRIRYSTPTGPVVGTVVGTTVTGYIVRIPDPFGLSTVRVTVPFGLVHYDQSRLG